jgi:hypothetical protein
MTIVIPEIYHDSYWLRDATRRHPYTRKDYFISKPRFCRLLRVEPQNAILATVIPDELGVPAIEGSAQGTSGAVWAEPQDSCQGA